MIPTDNTKIAKLDNFTMVISQNYHALENVIISVKIHMCVYLTVSPLLVSTTLHLLGPISSEKARNFYLPLTIEVIGGLSYT